jgi:hypothetical protein
MHTAIVFGIVLVARSAQELREMIKSATAEHTAYAH